MILPHLPPRPVSPWPRLLPLLLLLSCIDHTAGLSPTSLPAGAGGIAVVGSDYLSTSLAILDRATGSLLAEGVLHSGSAAPGLSVALSGDVVLASAPEPGGRLLLLDRYPAAVVTILDRDTFRVLGQIGVGTGFAANPHDLLVPVPGQAWVTRYEANPSPGRMPCDGGDDVLRIDLDSGAVTGCTPLGLLADPGLRARPERFAAAEGRVWVTLGHLAEDFGSAGPGLVAGLDAATGELLDVVELPELANCAGLLPVPGRPLLAVSCTGLFAAGPEEQRAASGLALVDLATEPPAADLLLPAGDGGPFGFELAVAEGRWLLAPRFGDPAAGTRDRLVAVDLEEPGVERLIHEASSAAGLGGLLADDREGIVWVGDADPAAPRLLRFRVEEGAFTPAGEVVAHPARGLPPRQIAFY